MWRDDINIPKAKARMFQEPSERRNLGGEFSRETEGM